MKNPSETMCEMCKKATAQNALQKNHCENWCIQEGADLVDKHTDHGA
jgi:hypothetical protein